MDTSVALHALILTLLIFNKLNNMKKTISTLGLIAIIPSFAIASVGISGTALQQAPGISSGQTAVFLVDLDGSAFSSGDLSTLTAGLSTSADATYAGFSVFAVNTAGELFGSPFLEVTTSVDLNSGIDEGDSFGILVFNASSGTTTASDTYNLYTDGSWMLPADGANATFGGAFATIDSGGSISATGSVVPEPSTFAALAGMCALGYVMIRRRRA
jgi:hypothetical protein